MTDFSVKISKPAVDSGAREISVTGALTIQNAEQVRDGLLAAFTETDDIRFGLDKVTDMDLTGLQLLCAAHRTATVRGKSFTLGDCCSESVRNLIQQGGFSRHVGCGLDKTHTCIWVWEGGH